MIEFDEEENSLSPVTDITLQLIAEFFGPEVKDMLLYRVNKDDMELNRIPL